MQFDQFIDGIKENPTPYACAAGAYLIVGMFVLWRLCRRGAAGHVSLTGFARALLTALFALPIWPIIWLVWVLHFRKFAPDALDLTNYRLPVIDLADHRADDIRFAPKKLVMDAEIVESPQGSVKTEFAPFGSNRDMGDAKPRVKTTPVSSIAAKTRTDDPPKPEPEPKPEVKLPSEPSPPGDPSRPKSDTAENPKSVWPKVEAYKAAPLTSESAPPPLTPTATPPPTSAAPPPPPLKRSPVAPPPSAHSHPRPAVAPNWPSVALDPRTPEPPSAPPFVKKIERLDPDATGADPPPAPAPAPFPSPTSPPSGQPLRASVPRDPKNIPDSPTKPDVPEIPIH